MIGFVTWPPFFALLYKGGQLTKPIIVVKICYKLLYVIHKKIGTSAQQVNPVCHLVLFCDDQVKAKEVIKAKGMASARVKGMTSMQVTAKHSKVDCYK